MSCDPVSCLPPPPQCLFTLGLLCVLGSTLVHTHLHACTHACKLGSSSGEHMQLLSSQFQTQPCNGGWSYSGSVTSAGPQDARWSLEREFVLLPCRRLISGSGLQRTCRAVCGDAWTWETSSCRGFKCTSRSQTNEETVVHLVCKSQVICGLYPLE